MKRKGKFRYENGEPLNRNHVAWVRNGKRYECSVDEFGNFQLDDFPDEWVNEVLVDGQVARRDWDVGRTEDFGDVYLSLSPVGKVRQGRILHEGGEPLEGMKVHLLYRGDTTRIKTDGEGRFQTDYPHSWVDQVVVDGAVVHEDWDVGDGQDMGELRLAGGSGDMRVIRLRYDDGTPVSEEEVLWVYHGEKYFGRTKEDGTLRIKYPHDWVDQMIVAGLEVRTEWDLGGKKLLEDWTLPNSARSQEDGEVLGAGGIIFWSDGTALDKPLEVRWADSDGYVWTSEARGGYCKDNGSFLVPIGSSRDSSALSSGRWFIGGHEPRFSKRVGASRFFHVLPDSAGGGGSTTGGLVTGFTVDHQGHPIDGIKVRGEVASNAFLSFLGGGGDSVEVKSDRRGGFALGFQGGGALKNIYLNGHHPARVYIKNSAGEEIDIPTANGISAGSFALYCVVPRSGLFA